MQSAFINTYIRYINKQTKKSLKLKRLLKSISTYYWIRINKIIILNSLKFNKNKNQWKIICITINNLLLISILVLYIKLCSQNLKFAKL